MWWLCVCHLESARVPLAAHGPWIGHPCLKAKIYTSYGCTFVTCTSIFEVTYVCTYMQWILTGRLFLLSLFLLIIIFTAQGEIISQALGARPVSIDKHTSSLHILCHVQLSLKCEWLIFMWIAIQNWTKNLVGKQSNGMLTEQCESQWREEPSSKYAAQSSNHVQNQVRKSRCH